MDNDPEGIALIHSVCAACAGKDLQMTINACLSVLINIAMQNPEHKDDIADACQKAVAHIKGLDKLN